MHIKRQSLGFCRFLHNENYAIIAWLKKDYYR